MGICCLLNQLPPQINTLLHIISHNLEVPNVILSHKTSSKKGPMVHEIHQHKNIEKSHEHVFINLIDSIFEASNTTKNSNKSMYFEIELDKHPLIFQSQLPKNLEFWKAYNFWMRRTKQTVGHLIGQKKPPQDFPS